MGIFDRLSTLIRSNINDLISRAENPEKMLNQLIVDMRTQLAKAKQQVASAIAEVRSFSSTRGHWASSFRVCIALWRTKRSIESRRPISRGEANPMLAITRMYAASVKAHPAQRC